MTSAEAESRYYLAPDGLRLHYRDYRPDTESIALPLVCLAGLTRSSADFERLGLRLAADDGTPRRVVAFDYRGRGLSDYDPDWHHYDLATERADFLTGLALLGIERAHFFGTSRGGLHIMALAAIRRDMIHSAVFNDIGPVLEPAGLKRIKRYLGATTSPADFIEAKDMLRAGPGLHFDGLDDDEWNYFVTTTFGTDSEHLARRYDPKLARTLDAFDLDKPLPDNWALFDTLRGTPVLTIRGANSDLLSAATLEAMRTRWPDCESLIVPGQGHAPLVADTATIVHLAAFLQAADQPQPTA